MELTRLKELAELGIITQTHVVEYYEKHSEELSLLTEDDLLLNGLVTIVACPELNIESDFIDITESNKDQVINMLQTGNSSINVTESVDLSQSTELIDIPAKSYTRIRIADNSTLKIPAMKVGSGSTISIEGNGENSIIESDADKAVIKTYSSTVDIKNITIKSSYSDSIANSGVINDMGKSKLNLENVKIESVAQCGVVIDIDTEANINNCTIESSQYKGVNINTAKTVDINNSKIIANNTSKEMSGDVAAAIFISKNGIVNIDGENTYMRTHGDNPCIYVNAQGAMVNIKNGDFGVETPGETNYTLNQIDSITGSAFAVSGGKFNGFDPEHSAESDHRSFLANGYRAVEDDNIWTVIPENRSSYIITSDCPSEINVGEDKVINVTLSPDAIGEEGWSNAIFKFETQTPDGGQMTYKANDSLGSPFEFINNGTWGPEEGFPISADYTATTPWTINASIEGQYVCNITLINVIDNRPITSASITVNVVKKTE